MFAFLCLEEFTAAGSFLAPEFSFLNYWYAGCRSWYAVCTWYAESRYVGCRLWYAVRIWYAGFGMLPASGMQDFLLHFCECNPLNTEIFFFLRGQPSFVYIILFFANLSEPFLLFWKIFFGFYVFLTLDTELGHKFIFWLSGVIGMLACWFAPWAGPRTGERWTG